MTSTLSPVTFVDQTGQLGGAELWLLDLVSRRSCDDRVVLLQDGPFLSRLAEAGVQAEVLSAEGAAASIRKNDGWLKQIAAISHVNKLAQKLSASLTSGSVLYANTPKALVIASLASRQAKTKLIYHLHDIISEEHFSLLNRKTLIFLANRYAARVVANSQQSANAFSAAGGKPSLLSIVHNGIDATPIRSAAENKTLIGQSIRNVLGMGETPVVAVFGRISPWKGQLVAIKAVSQLPEVHLLLIGESLFGEEEYASQIEVAIASKLMQNRVLLLGFRDDIPELLQAADVVVHCSTSPEPFGRVIVEGMLAERPVIAANAGGATEIIDNEKTGILTEPGNADELAAAIRRVLDNPKESQEMASAGRADALKRFNIDDRVAEINTIIQQVANGQ